MKTKQLSIAVALASTLLVLSVAAALAFGSKRMPPPPAANEPVERAADTTLPQHLV